MLLLDSISNAFSIYIK